jgi:hypothetical protein
MELREAVQILVPYAKDEGNTRESTREAARLVLARLKEQEDGLKALPAMTERLEKAMEGR